MEEIVLRYIEQVLGPLIDPSKRIFVGYLFSALLLGITLPLLFQGTGFKQAWFRIFNKPTWWSRSARADYGVFFINQALMMGIIPRLVSTLAFATLIFEGLHLLFGGRVTLWNSASPWIISSLFTVFLFLLDDFSRYAVHRALHRIPVLWSFHKVHHSAETLNPVTVFRTHPVEGVLFTLRATVVQAIAVAGFMYFFGSRFGLVDVLGANAFVFVFNIAGSNLRHSPVWISYGQCVEKWLISPAQHQIHHSVEKGHHDRNFGVVLAIWDRLGGTLYLAGRREDLTYGLDRNAVFAHDFRSLYIAPFFEAAACLYKPFNKDQPRMSFSIVRRTRSITTLGVIVFALATIMITAKAAAQELNIYSHRQPFLIQPFIDAYSEITGTNINIVYASKGLAQRLQLEGEHSPADLILTVDIARLHVYADKDLLAPVDSEILQKNIPPHLRDSENRWFAFSKRARVIAVSKEAEDALSIKNYEELADPRWKGRICSRPGSHVYNRALIASMIHAKGVAAAENWAQGVVDNLARRPQGNDRAQVKAVYEGVCDIAIINNYYLGKLKHSDKEEHQQWANAVNLIFPNQETRGAHVNISGGGVAKHSRNKEEAVRFMEFLTTAPAQNLYGFVNYEYPVNPDVAPPDELHSWETFKEDTMPIATIAELAPEAQMVIDRVGW